MKKSRKIFSWILASIIAACSAAIVGAIIFNSEAIKWFAIAILGTAMVHGIYHIIAKEPKKIIVSINNFIVMILAGALVGVMHILPWWAYAIIILVCIVLIGVFIFGFTGHEKKKKDIL